MRFFLTTWFFLFSLNSLYAEEFRWPIEGIQDSFISSHFGESRDDHFHNGIDIASKDTRIYPVDDGEVIFYWDHADSLVPEEFGVGKIVILQHNKNRSYYYHLKEVMIPKGFKADKKTQIGVMGNSGRSSGAHLHLGLKKDGLSINPVKMLPPIKDNVEPVIKNIVFRSGFFQKMIQPGSNSSQKVYLPLRDNFLILVDAYDPADGSSYRRNIRKISVYIDGAEGKVFEKNIEFDFISNSKLNGMFQLSEIFTKIWNERFVILGKWHKKNRKNVYYLTVSAVNNMGNTTVVRKSIIFK